MRDHLRIIFRAVLKSALGSFEPLIAPIADDHSRAKGAVRHEPCARLVARMFTFWAKKIAYCIKRNSAGIWQ
ncbi:hypothetical protein CN210_32650 [Sinorhizobium meliloti]|nr:hypothetical protein CN210_32650 [Sinorhizobium meliloti]